MQTKQLLGLVLCFGVAFTLLSGSGIGAMVFGESPGDAQSTRTLDNVANQSTVDPDAEGGGLGADVTGDNEPTLVGIGIAGGKFLASLVGSVALLPLTLIGLQFPAYFSVAVGGFAQAIAFIGLVQFIRTGELL